MTTHDDDNDDYYYDDEYLFFFLDFFMGYAHKWDELESSSRSYA